MRLDPSKIPLIELRKNLISAEASESGQLEDPDEPLLADQPKSSELDICTYSVLLPHVNRLSVASTSDISVCINRCRLR